MGTSILDPDLSPEPQEIQSQCHTFSVNSLSVFLKYTAYVSVVEAAGSGPNGCGSPPATQTQLCHRPSLVAAAAVAAVAAATAVAVAAQLCQHQRLRRPAAAVTQLAAGTSKGAAKPWVCTHLCTFTGIISLELLHEQNFHRFINFFE